MSEDSPSEPEEEPVPVLVEEEPEPEPEPPPPAIRPLVRRHHWIVRVDALAQRRAAPRHDRERAPDLPRLSPLRTTRRAVSAQPLRGPRFPEWARLGGWLAGGLNWHFALAWPFVITGLIYLVYLGFSGEWRSLLFRPRDVPPAVADAALLPAAAQGAPAAGQAQRPAEGGVHLHLPPGSARPCSPASRIYKPAQLSWLVAALRRLRARALLALLDGLALRRLHAWSTYCWCSWWTPPRCGP